MGLRVLWVELDRALEIGLRLPIPNVERSDASQRADGLGRFGVEAQGALRRPHRLRHGVGWRDSAINAQGHVRVGKACMCQRVVGVMTDGFFKQLDAALETFFSSFVPVIAPFQIQVVGLRVFRRRFNDRCGGLTEENHFQLGDDRSRDVVLQVEDVLELAIVAFRPEIVSVFHVDQMRGDAQPVSGLLYAAFENRPDAELLA